jgi:hypothetical protein
VEIIWSQGSATQLDPAIKYGRVFRRPEIEAALRMPDPYQTLGYGPSLDQPNEQQGAQLTGIVKVKTAGYRPSQVRVRSVIGSHIFTADFSAADLLAIESDPQVEAVSLSQSLPLQKLPQP